MAHRSYMSFLVPSGISAIILVAAGLVRVRVRARLRLRACMVTGGEISGFGGGWLEHPRRWRSAQWRGLFP